MPEPVGIETPSASPLRSPALDADRHGVGAWTVLRHHCIEIAAIHPTQITVGRRAVEEKRRRYREAVAKGDQPPPHGRVPVVLGPKTAVFALDRHHWLCALLAEAVIEVGVDVIDDLSHLEPTPFWRVLDRRGWCHPCGADGRRLDYEAIPASLADLQDDPFRSLAGALRRKGGFEKNKVLFSEFLWADFLRGRIDSSLVAEDFEGALRVALELARRRDPVRPNDRTERPRALPTPA